MIRNFIAPLVCLVLVACVQVPDGSGSAPSVQLMLQSPKAYPGSSVQVSAIIDNGQSEADKFSYQWSSSDSAVTLDPDSSGATAIFKVGVGVATNQQVTLTASVKDADGDRTEKSISVDISNEPFIVIDGQTEEVQTANSKPLYLTGIYSAKQVNLKSADAMASDNYLVDISPDGRYVFYTQLLINTQWQARLFDAKTGLNHHVNLDFDNHDSNEFQSYWSQDSHYLAIQAPHDEDSAQDKLYWMSTLVLPEVETVLEPESETLSIDALIWSDNNLVREEQAHAALITGNTVKVLNPASETPLVEVLSDTGVAFTGSVISGASWTTNQLFFLGGVAVPAGEGTTNNLHLFRWSPGNGKTIRVSEMSTVAVDGYETYEANQVVYAQGNRLRLHDGDDSLLLTLTGSSVVLTAASEFDWSEDGQRLGILTEPSNTGNSGSWTLHSWATNSKKNVPVSWLNEMGGSNVADWQWNENRTSLTILSHDGNAKQNTIYLADGTVDDSEYEVVSGIFTDDSGSANSTMTQLETQLVRSEGGQWQLYWGYDKTNNSTHLDLWALNTETEESRNLSRLLDEYQKPVAAGVFENADGFDKEDPVYAGKVIHWVSSSELAFSVNSGDTSDEYIDIRYVDLTRADLPKSIILDRENLTEIKNLLMP
ncbi:hypothetical protein [Reinekea blandensis]|uniref:Uncharacterized protein n=1 Tax=Reinekea blandensis MED297 TaxID=314283 RepID=A4BEW5_9GAMM|nr:hypothetical protein [Reinekea blandensis]EAR09300.1 hypothetical protein MED297_18468 [Reinekea sp. MED297] [Reinekea blandensis MED297]